MHTRFPRLLREGNYIGASAADFLPAQVSKVGLRLVSGMEDKRGRQEGSWRIALVRGVRARSGRFRLKKSSTPRA
jgi:hypothetical protein